MSARQRRDGKENTAEAPPAPEPLEVPVPDSHTHLDLQEPEVGAAVEAATAVGVPTLVQIGIDVASSRWAADVAAQHDAIWATVALHPNEAPRLADLDAALAEIDALAARPEVRARRSRSAGTSTSPSGTARRSSSMIVTPTQMYCVCSRKRARPSASSSIAIPATSEWRARVWTPAS